MTETTYEVVEKAGETTLLVTNHYSPGIIARFFGKRPSSKTTAWHSSDGVYFRDDEGVLWLDTHSWILSEPPYEIVDRHRWLRKKYGDVLA